MKTDSFSTEDLKGVFAVPPLARRPSPDRPLDFKESEKLVRHIAAGGIRRFMFGGNAFLYHLTLREYEALLDWLSGLTREFIIIPSAGPSFGRAMDQALLLRKYRFPCVMMLPCGDPRDTSGLEQGLREIAEVAETKLLLYTKEESNFGNDPQAGLDVIGHLVEKQICIGIKYAIVRRNPLEDEYLKGLFKRVPATKVISGIGERPAIVHLRDWGLPGFTTGSGCIGPRLSESLFQACGRTDYAEAEKLREKFIELENLRDAWNPAKVLHYAVELSGVAKTGPIIPFLSPLTSQQMEVIAPAARALAEANRNIK